MRWELNDLARRLDGKAAAVEPRDSLVGAPADSGGSELSPSARRILEVIGSLPEEEREVFNLVRTQGMAQTEAAGVLGVSAKTVQRRLNRGLLLLADQLADPEAARRHIGAGRRRGVATQRDFDMTPGRGRCGCSKRSGVCRLPELLWDVRKGLKRYRDVEAETDAVFPPSGPIQRRRTALG